MQDQFPRRYVTGPGTEFGTSVFSIRRATDFAARASHAEGEH